MTSTLATAVECNWANCRDEQVELGELSFRLTDSSAQDHNFMVDGRQTVRLLARNYGRGCGVGLGEGGGGTGVM